MAGLPADRAARRAGRAGPLLPHGRHGAADRRRAALARRFRTVLHESQARLHRAVARVPDRAAAADEPKTLVVTNDFPPRQGGIQSYVHELARRQPAGSVVVYASDHDGLGGVRRRAAVPGRAAPDRAAAADAGGARRRIARGAARARGDGGVVRRVRAARPARAGAARAPAPSGSSPARTGTRPAGRCCPAPARRCAGSATHCDVITYITEYTRARLAGAFGAAPAAGAAHAWSRRRDVPARTWTARRCARATGWPTARSIVCVSRLVPRKGQDAAHRGAARRSRGAVPDAALLLVGAGPVRGATCARWPQRHGVAEHVVFTGGVPYPRAARALRRRRRVRHAVPHPPRAAWTSRGSASSTSRRPRPDCRWWPGDSGGAPEAVREGETGYVVGGRDVAALADRLVTLLHDAELRARLGAAGRAWVEQQWRWDVLAAQLDACCSGRGRSPCRP